MSVQITILFSKNDTDKTGKKCGYKASPIRFARTPGLPSIAFFTDNSQLGDRLVCLLNMALLGGGRNVV